MPIIQEATSHSSVIDDRLKLFVLNSSRIFGEQVGTRLAIDPSPYEEREFEDGEHKARPLISVRARMFSLFSPFTAMIGKAATISCAGFFSLSTR